MDQKAFYNITYGLYLLTTREDGRDYGCIINTVMQVGREPDRIAISVQKNNKTHEVLLRTGLCNICAITADAPFDLFRQFGMQSARDVDKFAGYPGIDRAPNTLPILRHYGNMYLSVCITNQVDMGTHTLFVGEVVDAEVLNDLPTCTYDHYLNAIKPKPKKSGVTQWECRVCGFVYEGEEVPDDYICPLCDHGKEHFVPVE